MSLTKKDPSFCVAANDPHLVSLGGGRLSTAVTIHNIPIGDTTIGSSTHCNISLNGSGIRPIHCTIYRSESNEVTLVPERDARILIDGSKIVEETNLTQGAMITIGKSYCLRFNNPAEAQQIRTAMGSSERISMPQMDFSQRNSSKSSSESMMSAGDPIEIEEFYESNIQPTTTTRQVANNNINNNNKKTFSSYNNLPPIDINGLQCPKVFTADLVTVNLPAEDVLGKKYTPKYVQNMAEAQRNEKNLLNARRNFNQSKQNNNIYDNVPLTSVSAASTSRQEHESSTKVKNNAYDRYPKLGNLQIFPMNSINSEMNTSSPVQASSSSNSTTITTTPLSIYNRLQDSKGESSSKTKNVSNNEKEHLDDMLKICTEYTDRQNQNPTANNINNVNSSPIVQNRIITNGSLPRERKSPFQNNDMQRSFEGSFNNLSANGGGGGDNQQENVYNSSGYENVRVLGAKRVEINGQANQSMENYENVVVGKYVPQSPRTKIRTTCMSPKKEQSFNAIFSQKAEPQAQTRTNNNSQHNKQMEYDELLRTFGEKLQIEMEAIEECSRYQAPPSTYATSSSSNASSAAHSPNQNTNRGSNRNVHNLKLNLRLPSSLQNSPKLNKKPAPAPRTLLKSSNTSGSLPHLLATNKNDIDPFKVKVELELQALQDKIHRLEAQRNATRVMEETQQAKLKQSIEMKVDQIKKLKNMLKEKPDNDCLKDELKNISESLENDRKTFEDLEFQYLEEESEWHAYHEELKAEAKQMAVKLGGESKQQQLSSQNKEWQTLSKDFKPKTAERSKAKNHNNTMDESLNKPYDIGEAIGIMSQSLFGSAEMLCPRRHTEDVMSRSVNENMFFNNKIELPCGGGSNGNGMANTSTPKRPQLQIVNIDDECLQETPKREVSQAIEAFSSSAVRFNLSLDTDGFEVNPLEKRVPSQDDIDRITKVTSDAPISHNNQGASTKIFDSIKEIERNRQLLLAQQGHHVIEHERQKMNDLKKRSHSEARAQYLSMVNRKSDDCMTNGEESQTDLPLQQKHHQQQQQQEQHPMLDKENHRPAVERNNSKAKSNKTSQEDGDSSNQQRHSQPEFETNHLHSEPAKRHSTSSRPLSEANSELSCELLTTNQTSKSNIELSTFNGSNNNNSNANTDSNTAKRPESLNSADANSSSQQLRGDQSPKEGGSSSERKRSALPKHQRPLTRYLPIFSPDLDLRQHIESAGHQIDLCPHVFVDSHTCRGYLHKLGATFHGWSKRWFVLDRTRNAFIYYSDKLERKPRGGAYFSTIEEVYLDHLNISKSGRPHCTFIVKTKKRSYQLLAASDAAARIWIDAIITGAQGKLDY
ncbi:pleckstrin homology-like domain family B member 1 isoform X1 [Musca domestica]|uniref:Pleckstrin homology-like domain family B member 1 isoform X1 n=2 Tax=Musca domestica TaxID=7370 RepID=A0ABM3VIF1_MUSDO|nr:pleckstrin homology-like domain family B member 1 isoform X1 [Musca domestica]XP_058985583.1 pleckstrin homology-like domain family B member 1 isoform X1 [Musca domestica]